MNAEDLKGMNGRKVLVEGLISDGRPHETSVVEVHFLGAIDVVPVSHSAIREILPAEIKVGDRVRHQIWPYVEAATVLALHNGRAWVLHTNGARDDLDQSRLILVEPAQ
jgi:hypothetical protein